MNLEIEAKFIHISPEEIRKKLHTLWFSQVYPEFFVKRATFICHNPHMSLRVRKEYGKITMTYKYTDVTKWALWTEEIEVEVSDFENALSILQHAHNPIRILFQESKRELWKLGETEVSIDEWPWTGKYIEIETWSEEKLKEITASLNLDYSEALFGRVGVIYEKLGYNLDTINQIENLTFENPPKII